MTVGFGHSDFTLETVEITCIKLHTILDRKILITLSRKWHRINEPLFSLRKLTWQSNTQSALHLNNWYNLNMPQITYITCFTCMQIDLSKFQRLKIMRDFVRNLKHWKLISACYFQIYSHKSETIMRMLDKYLAAYNESRSLSLFIY